MALTETQKLQVCEITGIDAITLNARLDAYAVHITAAVEERVELQIARWTAGADEEFDSIEPNMRNFGTRRNPAAIRADIAEKLGTLLFISDLIGGGLGQNSFTIERG